MELLMRCATIITLLDLMNASENEPDTGPVITLEPPSNVLVLNTQGALISCSTYGKPVPTLVWLREDGSPVVNVPGILQIYPNNSLHVLPFQGPLISAVHRSSYRCAAANSVGRVVSRSVTVKAVLVGDYKDYDVYTQDVWVIRGNTAVFSCDIRPAFVRPFVSVTTWYSGTTVLRNDERYEIMNSVLLLHNVKDEDNGKDFKCLTFNYMQPGSRKTSRQAILHVLNPVQTSPTIDYKQDTVAVSTGSSAILPCIAHAYPPARYAWLKDGKPLVYSDSVVLSDGNLHLRSARAQDSGIYTCNSSNVHGSTIINTALTVTEPLVASISPRYQEVDAGLPALLNCSVSGGPVRQILWYRNGVPLELKSNIRQLSDFELMLVSVSRKDIGMYQCLVSNSGDNTQATTQLQLGASKPVFHETLGTVYQHPGTRVSFKCVVYGNPTPNISWSIGDRLLTSSYGRYQLSSYLTAEGDVISQVNITNIQISDGGVYKCIAANSIGKQEIQAFLNVYGIPYVRPLENMTAISNQSLQLRCQVSGYPVSAIFWSKDGTQLRMDHRHTLSDDNSILKLEPVEAADAGWYNCTAKNAANLGSSSACYVTVITQPSLLPITFPELRQGEQYVSVCQVRGGDIPIDLRWYKNNLPITLQDNPSITVKASAPYMSTLSIRNVSPSDIGNYTCVATNHAGSVNSTGTLSTVNVQPYWIVQPKDAAIILGSSVLLPCTGGGSPMPRSIWKRAKDYAAGLYTVIGSSNDSSMEIMRNGSLLVRNSREADHGYYLCHLDNGVGPGISQAVFLTVHVPAYFVERTDLVATHVGSDVSILCDARGDRTIAIVWSVKAQGQIDWVQLIAKDDPRIQIGFNQHSDGFASLLNIKPVRRDDSGEYMCTCKNDYGHSTKLTKLVAMEVPHELQYLTATKTESRSVTLSWIPPDDGNSPILTYHVQYLPLKEPWTPSAPVMSTNATFITVTNLQPATSYKVRVIAENAVGSSSPSFDLKISMLEESPGAPPVQINVIALTSSSLTVSWQAPNESTLNGELKGFRIGYRKVNATTTFSYVHVSSPSSSLYTLTYLDRDSTYSVTVAAYNNIGSGPESSPVTATTLQEVPSEPPRYVKATVNGPSIRVSWNEPLLPLLYGKLEGYKVQYHIVTDEEDESDRIVITTTECAVTLSNLMVFTDYKIEVLAYTSQGDGVSCEPLLITTPPSEPQSLAGIRASVLNSSAVLISWLPPAKVTGIVQQYILAVLSGPRILRNITFTHPKLSLQAVVNDLIQGQPYSFKVKAKNFQTSFGEFSNEVLATPSAENLPPDFVLTSSEVKAKWHERAMLNCQAVGHPQPTVVWSRSDQSPVPDRSSVFPNGSLVIEKTVLTDAGSYVCTATNQHGTRSVTYFLVVKDIRKYHHRPLPPVLSVVATLSSAIQLKWLSTGNGGYPMTGWSLEMKDNTKWVTSEHLATLRTLWIEPLACARTYSFRMRANNAEGNSRYSETITVTTGGSKPVAPSEQLLLKSINRTRIELDLTAWKDGGCKISYFNVEYRLLPTDQWMPLNYISSAQDLVVIENLEDSSWYEVKVSAYNSAGSQAVLLTISTLTQEGYTIEPLHQIGKTEEKAADKSNTSLLISLSVSCLIIIVAALGVAFYLKKRRDTLRYKEGKSRHSLYSDNSVIDDHHGGNPAVFNIPHEDVSADSRVWLLHRPMHTLTMNENVAHKDAVKADTVTPYATFLYPTNAGVYEDCTPSVGSDTTQAMRRNSYICGDDDCQCAERFLRLEDEAALEKRKIKQYEFLFGACDEEFPPPPPEVLVFPNETPTKARRCASHEHVSLQFCNNCSRPNTSSSYREDASRRISQHTSAVSSMATVSSNHEELLMAYCNSKNNPQGPIQYETPKPITSSQTPESSDVMETGIRLFTQSPPKPEETRQAVCEVPIYSHSQSPDMSSDAATDAEQLKRRQKTPLRKVQRRKAKNFLVNKRHKKSSAGLRSHTSETSTNSDEQQQTSTPSRMTHSTSEGYGSRNKDSLVHTDASSRSSSKHRKQRLREAYSEEERTCLVEAGAQTGQITPPSETHEAQSETKLLDRYYRAVPEDSTAKLSPTYTDDYTIV